MTRGTRKSWMVDLQQAAGKVAGKVAHSSRTAPAGKAAVQGTGSAMRKAAVTPGPQGLGLTSERARQRMVERLREQGIRDGTVLAAMEAVPRHLFVDEGLASRAYEDSPLPIGHEQTISQPYIVAHMTELLCAEGRPKKVLEIGTGCGYQTAVLSRVADEVYSIERIRALHDRARANLRPLRLPNVRLVFGDGLQGIPEAAPFDAMLIAAAADDLPRVLLEQLRVGGRAIAPLGGATQVLCLIVRTGPENWSRTEIEAVRFVPLRPGTA